MSAYKRKERVKFNPLKHKRRVVLGHSIVDGVNVTAVRRNDEIVEWRGTRPSYLKK